MQREINSMCDRFFHSGLPDDEGLYPAAWSPCADIAEHDNDYVVTMELPGVAKEDVKITMQENLLTVRGEKKQEKKLSDSSSHRVERSYGAFRRSFTLPTVVRGDTIDASYKDGILTITLPKAEEARRKQIDVKVK